MTDPEPLGLRPTSHGLKPRSYQHIWQEYVDRHAGSLPIDQLDRIHRKWKSIGKAITNAAGRR